MQVAIIQNGPRLGEVKANMDYLLAQLDKAGQAGAKLAVMPEMAATGYVFENREEIAPYVEPIPGPTTETFGEVARRYGMYIVMGLPEVDPQSDIYYNSAVLIGPDGQIVGRYRKIHPFFPDTRWSRKGNLGFPVFATEIGRIGLIVCMDVSFFESTRVPALKGADIIVCPLNSRTEAPNPQWRARALENGVYMVVANRVGLERGESFSGGSAVIDPSGRIVGHLATEPGLLLSEVSLDSVHQPYAMVGDRLSTRCPQQYHRVLLPTYLWPQSQTLKLPREHQSTIGVLEMDGSVILEPLHTRDTASALAQLRSLVVEAWQQAKGKGRPLDLLVLPELCAPPGPIPGDSTNYMTALAEDLQIHIVFGMAEATVDGKRYNSSILVGPAGVVGCYRKVHLNEADRSWASPGDQGFPTFDLPLGRIGLLIGTDLFYPESARCLAKWGVDLVCVPAAWQDGSSTLLWKERANTNNLCLAISNWGGHTSTYAGNSGVQGGMDVLAMECGLTLASLATAPDSNVRRKSLVRMTDPQWYEEIVLR